MTWEALAERSRGRIEADGVALIPAEDVRAALTGSDDGSLSVDDALTAFAESNGWTVGAKEPTLNPAFIFREREQVMGKVTKLRAKSNAALEEAADSLEKFRAAA